MLRRYSRKSDLPRLPFASIGDNTLVGWKSAAVKKHTAPEETAPESRRYHQQCLEA
jgi:hypothetical protein